MAIRALLTALLAWSPAHAARTLSSVTPLEKVITLLEELEAQISADGQTEAAAYNTFANFCKDKTETLSESIINNKDAIDVLSSTIADKTALRTDKIGEQGDRTKTQDALVTKLETTKTRCAQTEAEYEAVAKDLSDAIKALQDATKTIEDSWQAKENLIAMKAKIKKATEMADAMKIIDNGPRWSALNSFLQVDPTNPDFQFHSVPVLNVLSQLEDEYRKRKGEADDEWGKAEAVCTQTIDDTTTEKDTNADALSQLATDIDDLANEIAAARGTLVETDSTLKDDKLYMEDLTVLCEKRANEWDQRTQMRADELSAIKKALGLLKSDVTDAETVNKRAFVQVEASGSTVPASVALLQETLDKNSSKKRMIAARNTPAPPLVENHKAKSSTEKQKELLNKAMNLLQSSGRDLKSMALSALAVRVAADPFNKVKGLIQKLIERLLAEANAEATKKGFCDKQMSTLKQDRSFRYEETMKLNAKLRVLEAKELKLELEIEDLTAAKTALEYALGNATESRKEEKDSNLDDIKTARNGLTAVTKALQILKTFYKEAAKAPALLQGKYSPVEEDNPGAGFEGNYRGSQEAKGGIVGLLEVIKSDFARTVRTTTKSETEAAAAFVKFDRASRADISGKETKISLDEEDLASTKTKIESKMKEMQENMDLTDTAVKELEALNPMCVDTGMSYDERVSKREKEIEALRKAFCLLDEEGVEEAQCTEWGV